MHVSLTSRAPPGGDQEFKAVIERITEELGNVVSVAAAAATEKKKDTARKATVKLSDFEQNRKFLARGGHIPDDPALRLCAVCGHDSVDEPSKRRPV